MSVTEPFVVSVEDVPIDEAGKVKEETTKESVDEETKKEIINLVKELDWLMMKRALRGSTERTVLPGGIGTIPTFLPGMVHFRKVEQKPKDESAEDSKTPSARCEGGGKVKCITCGKQHLSSPKKDSKDAPLSEGTMNALIAEAKHLLVQSKLLQFDKLLEMLVEVIDYFTPAHEDALRDLMRARFLMHPRTLPETVEFFTLLGNAEELSKILDISFDAYVRLSIPQICDTIVEWVKNIKVPA